MDSAREAAAYEITLRRGPRQLRVRQRFASLEAARAYVRDQWTRRSLGSWYEPDLPSAAGAQHMILAGNESYWISPALLQRAECPGPRPVSADPGTPPPARPRMQRARRGFEAWVGYAFDRRVPEDSSEAWYWEFDSDRWDESAEPHTTVNYLTRLFEDPSRLLEAFSDAQVAQGLGFLINNSHSNHMFALMNPDVAWPERRRCIRAMYLVFERVFAPRCSPRLSHVLTAHDASINPLNGVCYMWWDVCPLQGNAGPTPSEDFILETEELIDAGPRVDPFAADLEDEILHVLRETLQLESVACQEAALHGLGHRFYKLSNRVESIVDEYLKRQFPTWPEGELEEHLKGYALAAKRGRVQ